MCAQYYMDPRSLHEKEKKVYGEIKLMEEEKTESDLQVDRRRYTEKLELSGLGEKNRTRKEGKKHVENFCCE